MTELRIAGLVKRFGDVAAVDHVDLTVEAGSLVALLGPSGCGKTTTLRMVAGLEEPSEGDVLFDGVSVLGVPPERRNIGMVFQRYVLFPHMSVAKNVSFGLRMRGVPAAEVERRVAEVLAVVQLEGFANRFPSQLSGGQQQRVAIARTVITDPKVMLMDEPLSNLDAKLREEMRAFITRLQRQLGITTLFVTHDQVEAIELADRIGVMFEGRLVQFGTPEEIFNRPRNRRVADFMGATNLIPGRLGSVDRAGALLESAVGPLRLRHAPHHVAGAEGVATVRPEHLDLAAPDAAAGPNRFPARVEEAVYYGGTLTYRIAARGLSLQVRDRSTRRFAVGEEVMVSVDPDHLWVFPD
jgi:putative spermidine/putrescine transport system ATP-binding protein